MRVFNLAVLVSLLALIAVGCSQSPQEIQPQNRTGQSISPSFASTPGTESLGDIDIPIPPASGVVVAGVGLVGEVTTAQPGDININVPGTPVKAILYWCGHMATDATDLTITLNGAPLAGTLIGGVTEFFGSAWSSTVRADITSMGLITSGPNTITVGGLDFTTTCPWHCQNLGVGLLVVYDDGSEKDIMIKDGNDNAFYDFDPPLDTTTPVVYNFSPAPDARMADLCMFAASVSQFPAEGGRPNVVDITFDVGAPVRLVDPFQGYSGDDFDAVDEVIEIPAGASSATIQAKSEADPSTEYTGIPASFSWMVSALSVPPGEPPLAAIGDYVWCDLNMNGIQDENEPPKSGVTVTLYDCDDNLVEITGTDGSGYYLFDELTPGDYYVCFDLPAGYVFSPPNQGSDDAVDSDANPVTGCATCTTLDPGETDLTWDAGMYEEQVPVPGCRMTGGGVDEQGNWDGSLNDARSDGGNEYTMGGQAGAPTALQPQPYGEWTHHNKKGPDGSFTFHAGTASAPPGTEIDWIECSDPGWCVQARQAPSKQIDFAGVGVFKNVKGNVPWKDKVVAGESLHWFEVNVDDLGEPGRRGKVDPPLDKCPADGFGRNATTELADCDCPDFYRITIYEGPTSASPVLYTVEGYIRGGNFQIHPLTGKDQNGGAVSD